MTTPDSAPVPDRDRWDASLLSAGFVVDPDAHLSSRLATELADDGADLDDPWRDAVVPTSGLSDEQRAYLDATSPAFGAALPAQTLTGDDPLADIAGDSLRAADDDVIDFD